MSALYYCGLFSSGIASGLVSAYPAVCNRLFIYTKQFPITERLSIWLSSFEAGKSSMPIFALASAGMFWFSGKTALLPSIVSILSIIPYTILFMSPTNNRLISLESMPMGEIDLAEVEALFDKWSYLHLYRVAAVLFGFGFALYKGWSWKAAKNTNGKKE